MTIGSDLNMGRKRAGVSVVWVEVGAVDWPPLDFCVSFAGEATMVFWESTGECATDEVVDAEADPEAERGTNVGARADRFESLRTGLSLGSAAGGSRGGLPSLDSPLACVRATFAGACCTGDGARRFDFGGLIWE